MKSDVLKNMILNSNKFVTGKNRVDSETKRLMIDVSEFGSEGDVNLAVRQRITGSDLPL